MLTLLSASARDIWEERPSPLPTLITIRSWWWCKTALLGKYRLLCVLHRILRCLRVCLLKLLLLWCNIDCEARHYCIICAFLLLISCQWVSHSSKGWRWLQVLLLLLLLLLRLLFILLFLLLLFLLFIFRLWFLNLFIIALIVLLVIILLCGLKFLFSQLLLR